MPYPYDQVFAADPAAPENVASNGVVTIFAPGDPDRTPLTITTLDGLPLSNPIQVNDAGFGPAFMHATLDQVAWAGGGFSGLFVSYKGMKDEAVAARKAAEAVVTEVQSPTDVVVDRGILRADIPGKVAAQVEADPRIKQAAADAAEVKNKALANDAGVASLLKTGAQSNAALAKVISETALNVKLFGLKGDGTTDDTAAFKALIAALPAPANAFGAVAPAIYFPAGRYILDGSFVFSPRVTIKGDGPYQTILNRKAGATGDFITLNGANSVIRELCIDGSRFNGTSGDNLVLNASNTSARHLIVTNSAGNGITVGKTARALNHRIESVSCNLSALIGIQVVAGNDSTDGKWLNVGVGSSGKQGIRIDEAAQQLVNVHSWGNGVEATGALEGAGIYITSSSNTLSNCQSETNWTGIAVLGTQSTDNAFNGCNVWGNRSNGLYILNANGGVWAGCKVHKNGSSNTTGSTSAAFAGIRNEGGSYWTFGANRSFDSVRSIPAGSYSYVPSAPFLGRTARMTQSHHYYEVEGTTRPNSNTVTGNTWRSQDTLSGVAAVTLGSSSVWSGSSLGQQAMPTLTADGSTLTPYPEFDVIKVSGKGAVNNITPTYAGRKLTLIFVDASPGGVWNGTGNLKLAGNFIPTTNSTLSLVSDGTDWYETGRG